MARPLYISDGSRRYRVHNPTTRHLLAQVQRNPRAYGLTSNVDNVFTPDEIGAIVSSRPADRYSRALAHDLDRHCPILNARYWVGARSNLHPSLEPELLDEARTRVKQNDIIGACRSLQTAFMRIQPPLPLEGIPPDADMQREALIILEQGLRQLENIDLSSLHPSHIRRNIAALRETCRIFNIPWNQNRVYGFLRRHVEAVLSRCEQRLRDSHTRISPSPHVLAELNNDDLRHVVALAREYGIWLDADRLDFLLRDQIQNCLMELQRGLDSGANAAVFEYALNDLLRLSHETDFHIPYHTRQTISDYCLELLGAASNYYRIDADPPQRFFLALRRHAPTEYQAYVNLRRTAEELGVPLPPAYRFISVPSENMR